jgi:ABC-type multidrug transport system fused ATPase/permease subunit
MLIAAIVAFIASFLKRLCFGIVGEAVTYQLRIDLFKKIINQSKSWFDQAKN